MNRLKILPLRDDSLKSKLLELKRTFETSYGPSGKLKLIAEQSGEQSYGSSSTLFLRSVVNLYEDDPVIKLLFTSIKEHLKNYKDFGLFCSFTCLSLLHNGLKTDVPASVVTKCYEKFLSEISDFISSSALSFDVSSLTSFTKLLNGVIRTKPALKLTANEVETWSMQILKACIKQMPCKSWRPSNPLPAITYQQSTLKQNPQVFDGVILELCHYTASDLHEICAAVSLKQNHRAIVINLTQIADSQTEMFKNSTKSEVNKFSENETKKFMQKIADCKISILFSQRIISDEIKKFLSEQSVTVIDRIGRDAIDSVKDITKCKIIEYFCEEPIHCVGGIDDVNEITFDGKSYILLTNSSIPMCSIIVFYSNPAIEHDVRHVCTAALHTFWQTVNSQKVLPGGGKLEIELARNLRRIYSNQNTHTDIPCTKSQFLICLENFCSVFEHIGHMLHDSPNNCPEIQDCFTSKYSATMVAVQTACMVLGIQFHITD
ncbi:molecular chaperone MKKS [Ciona intestinalis]